MDVNEKVKHVLQSFSLKRMGRTAHLGPLKYTEISECSPKQSHIFLKFIEAKRLRKLTLFRIAGY